MFCIIASNYFTLTITGNIKYFSLFFNFGIFKENVNYVDTIWRKVKIMFYKYICDFFTTIFDKSLEYIKKKKHLESEYWFKSQSKMEVRKNKFTKMTNSLRPDIDNVLHSGPTSFCGKQTHVKKGNLVLSIELIT